MPHVNRLPIRAALLAPWLAAGLALAAPATPAVPGGGNPQSNNPHGAAPAIPGGRTDRSSGGPGEPRGTSESARRDESGRSNGDVRWLMPRETGELLEEHQDVRDHVRERWQGWGRRDRVAFLRSHPMWQASMFTLSWDRLTFAQRGDFVAFYPEFFPVLQLRWDGMTVDSRNRFAGRHTGMSGRLHRRDLRRRGDREDRGRDGDERREGRDGRR